MLFFCLRCLCPLGKVFPGPAQAQVFLTMQPESQGIILRNSTSSHPCAAPNGCNYSLHTPLFLKPSCFWMFQFCRCEIWEAGPSTGTTRACWGSSLESIHGWLQTMVYEWVHASMATDAAAPERRDCKSRNHSLWGHSQETCQLCAEPTSCSPLCYGDLPTALCPGFLYALCFIRDRGDSLHVKRM